MWVRLKWEDNRIKLRNSTKNQIVYNLNKSRAFGVHKDFLHHIWLRAWYMLHVKMAKVNPSRQFYTDIITVILKDGKIFVDHTEWFKITSSCPMKFNWFPFDKQSCEICLQAALSTENTIMVGDFSLADFSTFHVQNTLIDYDISLNGFERNSSLGGETNKVE